MATQSIILDLTTAPYDVNDPNEEGVVSYTIDNASPEFVDIEIRATPPVGSGLPEVVVGSAFSVSGSGFVPIAMDLSTLDPSVNYTFMAITSDGVSDSIDNVDITCFVEGTLILTARGEVPVEALRAGDLVATAGGGALKPIRWMGHSRVSIARHPNRGAVAPILIRAGALAEGVPHRDLRVSPEHAMFLDGQLVPARLLVNGTSIIQELWCPEITYWHVELEAHGLLVSDGAVSESYFDDGNRANFDNAPVTRLVKDFASERTNGRYARAACAPLMEEGPALTALRLRIAVQSAPTTEAA